MLSSKSSLSFSDLFLTRSKILAAMGYSDFEPEYTVLNKIDFLLKQTESYSSPSFDYVIYDGYYKKDLLKIENLYFQTGQIIGHALKGSTQFAIFTVTAGIDFQKWMDDLGNSDDMIDRYIVDCIGTEIAESTADYMQKQLAAACQEKGCRITNRYSPGYCGWDVKEQHKLFSLLDNNSAFGVRLMQSGLMYPIKSVSGIIGIGIEIEQLEYGCSLCNYPKCFKRKL